MAADPGRAARARALRATGLDWDRVAAALGLSRQFVQTLCKDPDAGRGAIKAPPPRQGRLF